MKNRVFFFHMKKNDFFDIFWGFPSSFLNFLSQKDGSNVFWNIQFCRARRVLSNYIKIFKKKNLLHFWITNIFVFHAKNVWNFLKFLKFDITKFTKSLLFSTNKSHFWRAFIWYKIHYILLPGIISFPILYLGVPCQLATPL